MAKNGPKHYDKLVEREQQRINKNLREDFDEVMYHMGIDQDKVASECIKCPSVISRCLAVTANNTLTVELEMLVPLGLTIEKRIVSIQL